MGRVGSLGHYDTNHYGDCPGGWIMGYRGGTRDSQEARGSRPLRTSRPSISDSMVLVGNTPGRSILSFDPFPSLSIWYFTFFYPLLPLLPSFTSFTPFPFYLYPFSPLIPLSTQVYKQEPGRVYLLPPRSTSLWGSTRVSRLRASGRGGS